LGVKLESGTGDSEYLSFLRKCLAKALDEFHPDLVIYNAGTDVLAGDPLGRLNISVEVRKNFKINLK
jgi:histone deacetylase 11